MKKPLISRRQFVQLIAIASTGWPMLSTAKNIHTSQETKEFYKSLSDPWLTLAEVQEHLFPADADSPGAKDITALIFLKNMLDAPDTESEEKDFIFNGVGWLNDLSEKNHKQKFVQLSISDKEKILRTVESSRAGSRWLSLMMTYLYEALLSDPIYGGNNQQKGWKWLEHIPGFPTPTSEQVYFKLDSRSRRRRTKA